MSNVKTQAEKLRNQFNTSPSTTKELTTESLLKNLLNSEFHGKKIDVPIDWIQSSDNFRQKLEDIESLKKQILETNGLMQPIGIQALDGKITVVYGHRRLKAYELLRKEIGEEYSKIPAMLQVYSNPQIGRSIAQALENLGRSSLAPLEECLAIAELKMTLSSKWNKKFSNEELGNVLGGMHRKTIDLALTIASWPSDIHKLIHDHPDKFNISVLRNLAKIKLNKKELLEAVQSKIDIKASQDNQNSSNIKLSGEAFASFKLFLDKKKSNDFDDPTKKLILQQKKWLGSEKARRAMLKVLTDHFEEK